MMPQLPPNLGGFAGSERHTGRRVGTAKTADDGFHTRPARTEHQWRRWALVVGVVLVCVITAIVVLRATGDRNEQLQDDIVCTDIYNAEVCEIIESPDCAATYSADVCEPFATP